MRTDDRKRVSRRILVGLILAIALFFSSVVYMVPIQMIAAQSQNSGDSRSESSSFNGTSVSANNSTTNNANISIRSTGESKFVEPGTISTSSFPTAGQEISEPKNPTEEKIKNERIKTKSLSEPNVGTSSLTRPPTITGFGANVTGFKDNEVTGMGAAAVQPSNQTNSTTTQPSNHTNSTTIAIPSTVTGRGFEGLSQDNSGGGYPPDVSIAVGPNHIVQMVNDALQITDKSGNVLRTSTLESFFNVQVIPNAPCNPCDPIVLYDRSTDRYFASVMNVPDGTIRISASLTNDPAIPWKTFSFSLSPTGADCPDQPFIALSSDKLAVGTNVYSNRCGEHNKLLGTQHVIVNKADLISRTAPSTPPFYASVRDPTGFSERPVKSFSKNSEILIASIGVGHNIDHIKMITYSGKVPNIQAKVEQVGPIRILKYPPPASQPLMDIPLDTTGRLQSASMSSDGKYVWLSSITECQANVDHSCIRLIQFNPSTKQILQDFDLAIGDLDLLYPSLTITTAGDMVLSFGASSSNIFPSLLVTRQSGGSTPGSLDKPMVIKPGLSFTRACENPNEVDFPTCRYGDYFGASIDADPVNIHTAWVSGEYLLAPYIWGTFISPVRP